MTVENLNITVKTNADKAAAKLLTFASAFEKLQGTAASVGGGAGTRVAKGVEQVGKAAEKANKPMNNFLASLKRIAFYRIIRGIIKSISQAFQEGLEKAYLFSAAASDVMDRRFAAAMDSMKSSANAMKVQLGSAFIALLTALQPIIETLINLVIKLADAISQFFAAFTGKTYVKANKAAAQFADTMGRGGAAAKEWKNQLLGFDEINRLNEPNQGGGGGGTNPLDGFGGKLTEIDDWAKKLHDNLALIETVASAFLLGLGLILTFTGTNIPLGLGLIAIVGRLNDLHLTLDNFASVEVRHLHGARFATEEVAIRVTGEDDLKPHTLAVRQRLELIADCIPAIAGSRVDVAIKLDIAIVAIEQRDEAAPSVLWRGDGRDIANLKVSGQTAYASHIAGNVQVSTSSFLLEARGRARVNRGFGSVINRHTERTDFASHKQLLLIY